jgi:Protein of unknown function (DUF4238)
MSLEPTAPRPAPAFTADEERPITGRPFLVPLYVPHFTARSRPGGFSPFYRPEPLSSGPEVRMYHLRGSLTRNTNLQIQVLGNASEAVTLNRPKRHHVTPESYLNNFASLAPAQKSPRLSVLIRRTGEIDHRVKTKDIFYRHFYDHLGPDGRLHGSAEKPLNTEVEEPGNKVIASLLDGKAITYAQTRHLARYLTVAIVRSLWFHICLRAVLVEHLKVMAMTQKLSPNLPSANKWSC